MCSWKRRLSTFIAQTYQFIKHSISCILMFRRNLQFSQYFCKLFKMVAYLGLPASTNFYNFSQEVFSLIPQGQYYFQHCYYVTKLWIGPPKAYVILPFIPLFMKSVTNIQAFDLKFKGHIDLPTLKINSKACERLQYPQLYRAIFLLTFLYLCEYETEPHMQKLLCKHPLHFCSTGSTFTSQLAKKHARVQEMHVCLDTSFK